MALALRPTVMTRMGGVGFALIAGLIAAGAVSTFTYHPPARALNIALWVGQDTSGVGVATRGSTTLYRLSAKRSSMTLLDLVTSGRGPTRLAGNGSLKRRRMQPHGGNGLEGSSGEALHVVQTMVPNSVANGMLRNPFLDGIGPARYAEGSGLGWINQTNTGIFHYCCGVVVYDWFLGGGSRQDPVAQSV